MTIAVQDFFVLDGLLIGGDKDITQKEVFWISFYANEGNWRRYCLNSYELDRLISYLQSIRDGKK